MSGPPTCKDEGQCLILHNGTLTKKLMITDTTTTISASILADDQCAARFFLVGGGGEYGSAGGGGGSGYLKYSVIPLTETTRAQIKVGDQAEASTVSINGVNLEAAPGESDTYVDSIYRGGDGFCGGGGKGNGGSDGGDGAGDGDKYLGGQGTGEKLSSFAMASFLLTPGVGGQYYSAYGGYGGGGGGVLVNGAGPAEWDNTQGQGYGGGGCRWDSQGNTVYIGLRGVILLEMVP